MIRLSLRCTAAVAALLFASLAQAQVGQVTFAFGDVRIVDGKGERRVTKGATVNEGDTIVTGAAGSAQLKMIDGGVLALRPDTSLRFDQYRYAGKEDGSERGLLRMVRGGFRTITGAIGRLNKANYLVFTPTATIGIRGTDHEVIHIPVPGPNVKPLAPPGSYDKVNVGVAFIRTQAGTVSISQNQVGYAPAPNVVPRILPVLPDIFRSSPQPTTTTQKPAPGQAEEPVRADTPTDAPGQVTAASARATAPPPPATAVEAAAVNVSAPAVSGPVAQGGTAGGDLPITLTDSSGLTLDLVENTTTTSSGTVAPITLAAVAPAAVNFPDNTRVRHTAVSTTSPTGLDDAYFVGISDSLNLDNPASSTLAGPTVNTNYLFNVTGQLVEILDTPYAIFDHGMNVAAGTSGFATPAVIGSAHVKFGGGGSVAKEVFSLVGASSPDPILRMGRWQGGDVAVTDLSTGTEYLDSLISPLGGGSRSVHWLVRQGVPAIPTTGHFQYTRIGDAAGNFSLATQPTDSYGNVGTLDGARLTVNFLQARVSAGVRVTIASGPAGSFGLQNLRGSFADAPLQGGGFNVSSNPAQNPANTDNFRISCSGSGCAPNQTYGGRIRGAFAGLNAEAGFFRYGFSTSYPDAATAAANSGRVDDDYVEGLVGFAQGPAIVPPPADPTGPSNVLTTYNFGGPGGSRTDAFEVLDPSLLLLDGQGNLQAVKEDGFDDQESLAASGGTINNNGAGSTAPIVAANGITLGWRSASPALTLTGEDFQGCFGTAGCANPARTAMPEGLSWVRGPAIFPWYLPGAIATISNSGGTAVSGARSFSLSAATPPRDQNGVAGTLNSSTLSVNFNNQSVAFGLNATTPAGTWNASGSNVRLDDGGGFNAFVSGSGETTVPASINTHRQMSVTLNGGPAFGNVNGNLMGTGINGAGLVYSLGDSSFSNRVSGAVAYSNSQPFSIDTPYRLFGLVTGMNDLGGSVTVGGFPASFEDENTRVMGGAMARGRVQTDANGMPLKLDADFPVAAVPTGCVSCTVSSTQIPVVYAAAGATGVASVGTATLLESGRDQQTGVVWGRYGGGTIGVTDRITGASLGTIDATNNHAHFILSTVLSGPAVLPVSGTFNYTLVGNTQPTDNLGNVGVLNSAALTANFTAKTVDASLGLTVNGSAWAASAVGLPIKAGTFFEAEKGFSAPGNLAVTRDGVATSTRGSLIGGFTGPAGRGAAVMYSLNQGSHSSFGGTTVSGVAAFKR